MYFTGSEGSSDSNSYSPYSSGGSSNSYSSSSYYSSSGSSSSYSNGSSSYSSGSSGSGNDKIMTNNPSDDRLLARTEQFYDERGRVWKTEQRTRKDWAGQIQRLVDEDFPDAEKITLVMDNLNTHSIACLYETFADEEVKRIKDKLEIHNAPKHGSWLNMAEIELNVINNHACQRGYPR